ncbi:unnamed protein product, partial [marine sediment metagenome]
MEGRAVTLDLLGTNEQEIAYLAGFFDGEGCVLLKFNYSAGGPSSYLSVQLANVFPAPLYLCQRIFGGKVSLAKSRHGCNAVYQWGVYSKKAETFLTVVLPYLIIKKEEAVLALQHAALRGINTPRKQE